MNECEYCLLVTIYYDDPLPKHLRPTKYDAVTAASSTRW